MASAKALLFNEYALQLQILEQALDVLQSGYEAARPDLEWRDDELARFFRIETPEALEDARSALAALRVLAKPDPA